MQRSVVFTKTEPPERFGFRLAKSGKVYWKSFRGDIAIRVCKELRSIGISNWWMPEKDLKHASNPGESEGVEYRKYTFGKKKPVRVAVEVLSSLEIKAKRLANEQDKRSQEAARQSYLRSQRERLKRAEEAIKAAKGL